MGGLESDKLGSNPEASLSPGFPICEVGMKTVLMAWYVCTTQTWAFFVKSTQGNDYAAWLLCYILLVRQLLNLAMSHKYPRYLKHKSCSLYQAQGGAGTRKQHNRTCVLFSVARRGWRNPLASPLSPRGHSWSEHKSCPTPKDQVGSACCTALHLTEHRSQ